MEQNRRMSLLGEAQNDINASARFLQVRLKQVYDSNVPAGCISETDIIGDLWASVILTELGNLNKGPV